MSDSPVQPTGYDGPPSADDLGTIGPRGGIRFDNRSEAKRVLDDAATTIGAGGDRHTNYGTAVDNFTTIGALWSALLGVRPISAEEVAMCMTLVKLSRLTNSPNHRDSWVDAAGYVALGADIAAIEGRYL